MLLLMLTVEYSTETVQRSVLRATITFKLWLVKEYVILFLSETYVLRIFVYDCEIFVSFYSDMSQDPLLFMKF